MALINAIITVKENTKENTLITEFPKPYLDIYEELLSVGCRKPLERINLTDNEDDDLRVKIYAENDFGRHLCRLFGDGNTLSEVNTVCQAIANADDSIKEELEQNVLYDQYEHPYELLRDIKEMTKQKQTMESEEKNMNEWERMRRMAQSTKSAYPPGTRLELISMDDPYAPVPSGTRGTVQYVDDMGQIGMKWDNGQSLSLVPGEDSFRRLTEAELAEEKELQDDGMDEDDVPVMGM